MEKLLKSFTAWLFFLLISCSVHANIIAVLTESSASGIFKEDASGLPRMPTFNDPQISESFGGVGLGSAAIWDSTSLLDDSTIFFENGNASYGEEAQATSRTVVEIRFTNTTGAALTPTLNSQITPAGLGIYVSGCSAVDLRKCALRTDSGYDWQRIGDFVPPGEEAVGTRFDFRVVAGSLSSADPNAVITSEQTLFQLSGGLSLVRGTGGNDNFIRQDFGDPLDPDSVAGFLTDFRQTSPQVSEQQISFDWGATDFEVTFSEPLAPGESATVSYITEVTTFSNAFCFDTSVQSCPIAYGSFGDPIGRGGAAGQRPSVSTRSATVQSFAAPLFGTQSLMPQATASTMMQDPDFISGIDTGLYTFNLPTFDNGQIGFMATSGPGITSVPEPTSLALLILGLAFAVLRPKRLSNQA